MGIKLQKDPNECKSIEEILNEWIEKKDDERFKTYIDGVGGFDAVITLIKIGAVKSGMNPKDYVSKILLKMSYFGFEKILNNYKFKDETIE